MNNQTISIKEFHEINVLANMLMKSLYETLAEMRDNGLTQNAAYIKGSVVIDLYREINENKVKQLTQEIKHIEDKLIK